MRVASAIPPLDHYQASAIGRPIFWFAFHSYLSGCLIIALAKPSSSLSLLREVSGKGTTWTLYPKSLASGKHHLMNGTKQDRILYIERSH